MTELQTQSLWQNSWTPPDDIFAPLPLRHKHRSVPLGHRYCVFSDSQNFKVVEATNALDAIYKSGIENPARVKRIGSGQFNVYHEHALVLEVDSVATEQPTEIESQANQPAAEQTHVASNEPAQDTDAQAETATPVASEEGQTKTTVEAQTQAD